MYKNIIKRCIDFIFSLLILLFISPLFIFLIILLSVQFAGSPFFWQLRPGRYENYFKIIKFKTMAELTDINGQLLDDAKRITATGKVIRKYSLDELPQLINVIKGEMSLVGPRPLLIQYLPLYNERQKRRHEVKPGITGWAQVNGRNKLSWEEKFEYDLFYIENISFSFDMKILLLTLKKVFFNKDVNQRESVTAEYFDGSN